MSYRLHKGSVRREVRRVARWQLKSALKTVLNVSEEDGNEAAHEARTHIKKVRALIRLLRPALGDAFYKRENRALRNAAARMSSVRDADAQLETIRKLMARSSTHRAAFARIHAEMIARLQPGLEKCRHSKWCKQVAADIECAIRRIDAWPLKRLKARSLRAGLKAACKNARRSLANAREEASDAILHELRKSIKDLWYDLRLFRANDPQPIKAMTRKLRDLGKRLGADHDLVMLLAAGCDKPLPNPSDWEMLEKVLAAHRQRSHRATLRLATKVLHRKPGPFADFVFGRWAQWRAGA
jgi:CHAD domain-containing protein